MASRTKQLLAKLRLTRLIVFTLVALLAVWYFGGHQQMPLVLYKLSLAAAAVVLAIWADREAHPDARPHMLIDNERMYAVAQIRRAIIIAACIIGVCLGL